MKTRWLALMASGLIASVALIPSVAQADQNSLTQLFPALAGVQLTPPQQTKIETLSNHALPQMKNLLTPEQQTQFKAALSSGKDVRGAVKSLDLSFKQRRQISNILQRTRSQINAIPTPEQLQQVQQNVQALQQQDR